MALFVSRPHPAFATTRCSAILTATENALNCGVASTSPLVQQAKAKIQQLMQQQQTGAAPTPAPSAPSDPETFAVVWAREHAFPPLVGNALNEMGVENKQDLLEVNISKAYPSLCILTRDSRSYVR